MNVSARPALSCQELVELVTDYLEGSLAAEDVARFEAHISGCEACTSYLAQMRATVAALGHLPPESLSAEAQAELLVAFRDWRSHQGAP
jgi:anti-sigma factor RsiW